MSNRASYVWMTAILAAASGYSIYMASRLPDIVPTHWNAAGKADQYGSKWLNLLLSPGLILFMIVLTMALPALSPKNYTLDSFRGTYNLLMVGLTGLFLYIHIVLLISSADPGGNHSRLVVVGICVAFAFLGNLMGKVRRNFWMGIRTPWTLASEAVWTATHRNGGRWMSAAGIIGAILALFDFNVSAIVLLILLGAIWPIGYSYICYRQFERKGIL